MSSKLFSTIFISSEHCSIFLISSQLFLTHLSSSYVRKLLLSEKALTHNKRCTQKAFAQTSFCTQKLLDTDLHRKPSTKRSFCTWDAFTQRSFSTQKAFTHSKLLHKDPRTHRKATECTKYFPVLLWATRLAQFSSQLHEITNKKETKTTLHKTRPH